jgi:hypothetical protein
MQGLRCEIIKDIGEERELSLTLGKASKLYKQNQRKLTAVTEQKMQTLEQRGVVHARNKCVRMFDTMSFPNTYPIRGSHNR